MNQQSSLVSQPNAIQDCSSKSAQLVWFQSIDEIQQQLIPALLARGLARGLFYFQINVRIKQKYDLLQIFGQVEYLIQF